MADLRTKSLFASRELLPEQAAPLRVPLGELAKPTGAPLPQELLREPLATFSPCGRYRYTLRRTTGGLLDAHGQVTWIMLNPSTADERVDDATIRKVRGFSERWGYRDLFVVNAYAWRSADPDGLWSVDCYAAGGPTGGDDNDAAILAACAGAERVVCAWGKNLRPERRADLARLLAGVQLWALTLNGDGSPAHPLYLKNTLTPVPFVLEESHA